MRDMFLSDKSVRIILKEYENHTAIFALMCGNEEVATGAAPKALAKYAFSRGAISVTHSYNLALDPDEQNTPRK